jgi:hypothetical protein
MQYEISEAQSKAARHPHEIFLINLITNHILLFVAALSVATSYPWLLLPIPVISAVITTYLLVRARVALKRDSWFVKCHWQLAAKRSRMFLIVLAIMGGAVLLLLLVSGGNPRPQHWALGGAAMLPTMVTVLVLIVMESDAMHQARHGMLPKWVVERFPGADVEPVGE